MRELLSASRMLSEAEKILIYPYTSAERLFSQGGVRGPRIYPFF